MSVLEKIRKLLETNGVSYKMIEHPPVYTSEDAAKIRDVDISMGAKALVMFADKKPILIVVPGDKKADFRKIKKELSIKDLRMAKTEEVEALTSLEIGSIPPVGSVMNLKSYYAKEFLDKENVAFNAGSHTTSIIMKSLDLIKIENPEIFEITKEETE